MKRAGSDDSLRCSFCHKSQDVVGKLISSPSDYPRAYICDECIAVCNSILEDDRHDQPYRFGWRPRAHVPYPFNVRQYGRLLVLRGRVQDGLIGRDDVAC